MRCGLDQRVAVICQQIQQHQGFLTACPPKTATNPRVIALDRTTVAALREHREQQHCERQRGGADYHDSGYVFTAPNGDPLAPERLTRLFRQMVAEHRVAADPIA